MAVPDPVSAPGSRKPLKIVLAVFGSGGDVRPYIILGKALRRRGHEVAVAVNPYFASMVQGAGLRLIPLGPEQGYLNALKDPHLWHPRRSIQRMFRYMAGAVPLYWHALYEELKSTDLVVTSSFAIGARFAAEVEHVPCVNSHLQPSLFRSMDDFTLVGPNMAWMRKAPAPVKKAFFAAGDRFMNGDPLERLNDQRPFMGLTQLDDYYTQVMHGGDAVVALYPEWFAPRQPDWPAHALQFDFLMDPPSAGQALDPELEAFIQEGTAPVLWTFGTANIQTERHISLAEETSRTLRQRAIVVCTAFPKSEKRGDLFVTPFAPFADLIGRCAVVVHHGGIGTIAQCLRAGVRQVAVPQAYDQYDNGARLERLGVGRCVNYGSASAGKLARAIRQAESLTQEALDGPKSKFHSDPAEPLCDWLEGRAG
jgi:rhamnosyltransferase subunit B